LIGVDLKKDPAMLDAAYNDGQGLTAEFNRNLLIRINRECGADFIPEQFQHSAFYNPAAGRVEMHLVSRVEQTVHCNGAAFRFAAGEGIHTENSYKYSVEDFQRLARDSGWKPRRVFTDARQLFSLHYLSTGS
ncbi:MAG: L-histidine N(alpha)-methyltransferase, partial [Candidatus Binatia bacterium]